MATDRYSDNHTISVSGGSGTLTIDGVLVAGGDLNVIGTSTFDNVEVSGNIDIEGSIALSGNLNVEASADIIGTLSAGSIESNSISRKTEENRKIWIPAILFSNLVSAGYSKTAASFEDYSDGGESGSNSFTSSVSVEINSVNEIFVCLNQYLNKDDIIQNIEIDGSVSSANHVIHYTLCRDFYNGTTRLVNYYLLSSDNPNIIRTLDLKNVYIKTASSGSFSHQIYPSAELKLDSIYSGSSYIFRIYSDKVTYSGSGTCIFNGIYLTVASTSPV